jgi:hypothetical protein
MRGYVPLIGLSGWVIAKKLEQRFGVVGIGRLVKLVELMSARAEPGRKGPSMLVAWGDFMAALQCNTEAATEFLTYCEQARALDRSTEDGRLRVTLVGELASLLAEPDTSDAPITQVAGRTLFSTHKQWVDYFRSELDCPPYLANDPYTHKLFKRWCITNVTLDEVEEAIERAIERREAPQPAILHDYLKALRLEKLSALA